MLSPLIWLAIVGFAVIMGFGVLYVRKMKKMRIPCFIVTNIGEGKISGQMTKAGWFKSKTIIFGLYDWKGEEKLKTKDGRIIQGGKSDYYHEINEKVGLIVRRKDDDPKILLPIKKIHYENEDLLMEIAPVDYRDASNVIISSSESEMKGRWNQIIEWLMLGGTIVFALIAIIVITQMVKQGQAEAKDLILEAGRIVQEASSKVSTSAP